MNFSAYQQAPRKLANMDFFKRGGVMAQLIYVVDPMCSWCWGFAPVIRRLRDEAGHAVEVLLGGLRAGETRGMTPAMRHTIQHHWQQVAETTGQAFQFEGALRDGFVYDTEPACRAVVVMRQLKPAAALDYLHDLQEAFYARAQDLTQLSVLAELAEAHAVTAESFAGLWSDTAIQLSTAADFERKDQLGVQGFPCVLVDTGQRLRLVSMGYQPFDIMQQQIERRLLRDAENATRH